MGRHRGTPHSDNITEHVASERSRPTLSDEESKAFAAIVARLGDPERQRLRWIVVAASVGLLAPVAIILVAVLDWPWEAVLSFTAASLAGLVGGLFIMARRLFRRSG